MQELNDFQKRKRKKGKCITYRCGNSHRKKSFYCHSCTSKKYRKKYPIKTAYKTLKYNSKRRGKKFTLTFEEFKNFAIKVDLINKRGITKDSYHIDRIDETKGYTKNNIQLITNSQNIKKYKEYDKFLKTAKIFTVKESENNNKDVPF